MKAPKIELMSASQFYEFIDHIGNDSNLFFELHNEHSEESQDVLRTIVHRIQSIEKDINDSLYSAWSTKTANRLAEDFFYYSTTIRYAIENVINETKFTYYFSLFKNEAIRLKFEAVYQKLETIECQRSKGGKTTKAPVALCAAIGDLVSINPKISELEAWRRLKKVDWRGVISGREFSLKYDSFGDVIIQTEYIDGEPKGDEKPISQINVRDHLSKAKKYYKKKTIHKKVSE
jgi:hypothetical protein